jgi:hypothetical protein
MPIALLQCSLDLAVKAFSRAIELVVQPEPPEQDFDVTVFHGAIVQNVNSLASR